jgi:hypothetical protein
MIPKELYNISERKKEIMNEKDVLGAILADFSHNLQNNIYLPSIEINNDFILFRN